MLSVVDGVLKHDDVTESVRMEVEAWIGDAKVRVEACARGEYPMSAMKVQADEGEPLAYPDYRGA